MYTSEPGGSIQRPPLAGMDEISLPAGATLIFSHPRLDRNLFIHSGANAIKWSYELNTQTIPTIGGEVVQILSTFVGPMTITGTASGLRTYPDKKPALRGYRNQGNRDAFNPNDELLEIINWFHDYMEGSGADIKGQRLRDERAIKFQYPERGWDFYIQVIALEGFGYDRDAYAPEWSITAQVVDDNALNFFSGTTMHSFTDTLTNRNLLAKISADTPLAGLSAFGKGKTFLNSQGVFGSDGGNTSKNPFQNPDLSGDAATMAKKMGDNFQGLVAAWSTGDFAQFGFGATLDNGALPKDVDAAYQKLFGSSYIGQPNNGGAGAVGGSGVGSVTYKVNNHNIPKYVTDVLSKGGWPQTNENKLWLEGWMRHEGGAVANNATFNWLNSVEKEPGSHGGVVGQGSIQAYATYETGIDAQVKTINNGNYPNIVAALKSGNPYNNADLMLPDLTLWSGHGKASVPATYDPAGGKIYFDKVMTMNATALAGTNSGTQQFDAAGLAVVYPQPKGFSGSICQGPHITAGLSNGQPQYVNNWAIDFCAPAGTPVVAVEDGVISRISGNDPSKGVIKPENVYGWNIYLNAKSGNLYFYTHFDRYVVKAGQTVKAGQVIGYVGDQAKYGGTNHTHLGVTTPDKSESSAKALITHISTSTRAG